MNTELQEFSRTTLKNGLSRLTEHNHLVFKLMYSASNLDADINDVVDAMSKNKLDWAMQ